MRPLFKEIRYYSYIHFFAELSAINLKSIPLEKLISRVLNQQDETRSVILDISKAQACHSFDYNRTFDF